MGEIWGLETPLGSSTEPSMASFVLFEAKRVLIVTLLRGPFEEDSISGGVGEGKRLRQVLPAGSVLGRIRS
jgi:hypothetical protein